MSVTPEQAHWFTETFGAMVANCDKAVLGKEHVIRLALTCMLSEGHLLLEDFPGTGKTQLARALSSTVQGSNSRIQFTPDLLPSDVTGVTIGKGFSGPIKRHNFSSNRASHGNSISHNSPGSIGMAQDPGRVFPGKRMAGQYGNVQRTTQGLEIVRVDVERQLLLVKGAVPGAKGGDVVVRPAVKA